MSLTDLPEYIVFEFCFLNFSAIFLSLSTSAGFISELLDNFFSS